jgi:plasmid stabilization system protein ParE
MVEKKFTVLWNNSARKEVRKIYDYIVLDSYQNAQTVLNDIIEATEKLELMPTRFPSD